MDKAQSSPPASTLKKKSKLLIILFGLGCALILCIAVILAGAVFANKWFNEQRKEDEACKKQGEAIHTNTEDKCCNDLKLIKPRDPHDKDITGICSGLCGNGTCDTQVESNYNCPEDCDKEVDACYREGESIPVKPDALDCCEGLEEIKPKNSDTLGIKAICTAKCGNGICNPQTENDYNCPVDCAKDEACVPEGFPVLVISNGSTCCTGLTLIPPQEEGMLGISGFCTAKCGDGTCNDLIESAYNCPADCSE